jgi:hypothetical protein
MRRTSLLAASEESIPLLPDLHFHTQRSVTPVIVPWVTVTGEE